MIIWKMIQILQDCPIFLIIQFYWNPFLQFYMSKYNNDLLITIKQDFWSYNVGTRFEIDLAPSEEPNKMALKHE